MRAAAVLLGLLAVGLARGAEVVELDPSVDAVDQASEGALDKELASNKMLPENEKEKAQAFGKNYVLTTYATEDCSGKAKATKKVEACNNSPEIKECPNSMWTEGFKCRQTEKKEDMVFSQKWSWGVYNQQFVLRLSDGPETWTSLSIGKNLGDTGVVTCYSSTEDIRNVFLLNKVNSPSCKEVTSYGVGEDAAKGGGDNSAVIGTTGSFTLTPIDESVKLKSPDLAKPTLLYPPSYEFPNVPAKLPVPAGESLPVSLEAAETTAEKPKDPAAEAQKKSTSPDSAQPL